MKLKMIKLNEDYASHLNVGDIVEISSRSLSDDIVNISGGHYKTSQLGEYFEFIDITDLLDEEDA